MFGPTSVCAVFFWPRPPAEENPSPSSTQIYSNSITRVARACNREMASEAGQLSDINLSTLAARMVPSPDGAGVNHWGDALRARAVLIVPEDAMPGHALPFGHVFGVDINLFVQFPQRVAVPVTVFVLGPPGLM